MVAVDDGPIKASPVTTGQDEDSEPDIEESLFDAIEAAQRQKRLLKKGAEEDEGGVLKRRRLLEEEENKRPASDHAKINQLLNKWGLATDVLTKHVLESLTSEELTEIQGNNYAPDVHNAWKVPGELLQTHANLMREAKGPGGGPLDVVHCFRNRWKLDKEQEKAVRELCHKDLRYVMKHYDGSVPIPQIIEEAKKAEPELDGTAPCYGAVQNAPGVAVIGRYSRMEIIDPVSDCCVFGDANLTFSLNLVRQRKALGHVGRTIATTFEPVEVLKERYKEIETTIGKLEEHFAEVYHDVDCTRLALDKRLKSCIGSLGAVYWNFPHAGAVGGFFDGHPIVNWRHENLMRLFFRTLRTYALPGCVVKVASNSGAVGVRFSYIINSALGNEFVHVETIPFLQWQLHRYGRSYGDRRDTYKRPGEGEQYNSQRAESDMVYVFAYAPSGKVLPRQNIKCPPTRKVMLNVADGPLGERQGEAKKQLVTELWKRFMMECSGVHVG